MKEGYFINIAMESAIKAYINSNNAKDGLTYNSFLVVVVRILVLIYGKLNILNPYYLNDEIAFLNNLAKYNMSLTDIALFKEELLNYYKFELDNQKNNIKLKNPYFKTTLEYLIDMFIAKKKAYQVDLVEEEKFLELTYTTHTKNSYRISYGFLMLEDNLYAEKYYYSKLNELDVTKEINLERTINTSLNLEALDLMGINLTKLKSMSPREIEKAKENTYHYFEVDGSSPTREEDLNMKLANLKTVSRKLTSGNGYVDILLLMSVIITSISIVSIIIVRLII